MRDRAVALLMKNDKVVLIRRVRADEVYYVFPGGGIEAGETPEQATIREALEELGVVVKILRKIAEIVDEGTQHYYLASIVSGEFGSGQGLEMTQPHLDRGTYEPMWICYDQLEQLNVQPEQAVKMVKEVMEEGDQWMSFSFQVMTQEQAEEIAYHWQYEDPYAFYNMNADEADLLDFIDPQKRGTAIVAVMQGADLYAFLSAEQVGLKTYEIGLGMKPEQTGRGNGKALVEAMVDYMVSSYTPEKLILSVATFNQRAIHVYRQNGFVDCDVFMQKTNGDVYEFLRMERRFSKQTEK